MLDEGVKAALDALAPDIRARFARIVGLIQAHGLERVREPYVRHLEGPVWEMRMKGKDGIARAAYVTASGRRVVVVHVFEKKTQKTPAPGDRDGAAEGKGGHMGRKLIPVEEAVEAWSEDPAYRAADDALEGEFALASAMIEARAAAGMTQQQVAEAMGTTQAVVARLESGRVMPSSRTLQRFAEATGTRLRISFERRTSERSSRFGRLA